MNGKTKSPNGWPISPQPAEIEIVSRTIAGTDIKVRVAKKAAPYLLGFAAEFHTLVEPLDQGELDDWGYNYRVIRGTLDKPSNHASGTALDLNAKKHPLGKRHTFTPAQTNTIRRLAKKYHLTWGGDFGSRPDEMHIEIAFPPHQLPLIGN